MRTGQALVAVMVVLLVLVLLAALVGMVVYQGYNHVVALDEAVKSQWANVESKLQRRYDLIPNLVETAKAYGLQEQKVFLGIADARKHYDSAKTVNEKAAAASQMEGQLARLLVVVENYPQLKSSEVFLKLQDSLEGTENRLSVERDKYNDTVRALNTYIRQFPGRFYASLAGVGEAKYFEVESPAAKEAPKVDFGGMNAEPAKK